MTVLVSIDRAPIQRLSDLESAGIDAYPHNFARSHSASDVVDEFSELAPDEIGSSVSVMGRIMGLREHRHLRFLDLDDVTGRIQIVVATSEVDAPSQPVIEHMSRGDVVGVRGLAYRTRRGELSVRAQEIVMLAKVTKPLPEKHHGLADVGRLRDERHLHLIVEREARDRFRMRSRLISHVRTFLDARGFIEVTTPILQEVYGGAEARPFETHCNALEQDLYLRIATELHLKRLIVGGLERVYEIGANFRNEGVSSRHSPEFTAIEIYESPADYYDMMTLTEELLTSLVGLVGADGTLTSYLRSKEGTEICLQAPFARLTVHEAVQTFAGVDLTRAGDTDARAIAASLGVDISTTASADEVLLALFEAFAEPRLIQPTFVLDYPASLCPLTKRHRSNPCLAERFELYLDGTEVANAYSELSDPREQRRQFEEQARRRATGDDLAHVPDWGYCEALRYGLPPTGGLGIGIDRLMMLLLGCAHIADVILFPLRSRAATPSLIEPVEPNQRQPEVA